MTEVFSRDFPQVERYHSYPYGFQYTPSLRSGRMVVKLGSGTVGFMRIRDDIALTIRNLLETKKPEDADCHTTADYIANLGDNIGRVEESWGERKKYLLATDGEKRDYEQFTNIDDAVEAFKGFPFICRIFDQDGICHSLIVLGEYGNETVMGFEHRGQGTDWGFCEVEKAIKARRGEDLMCRRL